MPPCFQFGNRTVSGTLVQASGGGASIVPSTPRSVRVFLYTTGWPRFLAGTNYWLVLTPGSTLASGDGARWTGMDGSLSQYAPSSFADPQFLTARELQVSGGCRSPAAVSTLSITENWARQSGYKNFKASGSLWRYGVQLIAVPSL